jgi:hypothetical protein
MCGLSRCATSHRSLASADTLRALELTSSAGPHCFLFCCLLYGLCTMVLHALLVYQKFTICLNKFFINHLQFPPV